MNAKNPSEIERHRQEALQIIEDIESQIIDTVQNGASMSNSCIAFFSTKNLIPISAYNEDSMNNQSNTSTPAQ